MSDEELPLRELSDQERVEDAMNELVDRLSLFEAATVYWIQNRRGMTCEKALAIRRKGLPP